MGSVPALDDPPTTGSFRWTRRRSWKFVVIMCIVVVVCVPVMILTRGTGLEGAGVGALAVAGFGLWVGLATQPLRSRDLWKIRRVLRSPWRRVEYVVLHGAPGDPARRIVVILDPRTGQPAATWLVSMLNPPRWLGARSRCWAYVSVALDGRNAVLSSLDRSSLVLLCAEMWPFGDSVHQWAWDTVRERWMFDPPSRPSGTGYGTYFQSAQQGSPFAPDGRSNPSDTGYVAHGAHLVAGGGVHIQPDQPKRWPNRPMSAPTRVILLGCLVVVAISVTAATVARNDNARRHRATLRRDGVKTEAVVMRSGSTTRRSPTRQIEIEYTTGTGWTYGVRTSVPKGLRLAKGDLVDVAYDFGDPSDVVLMDIETPDDTFPIFMVWTLVVAVPLHWATRAMRAQKKRSRSP